MKKIGFTLISITIIAGSFAQNVFTYGKKAVTKDEFVRAFNKNPDIRGDRKEALREYLDLYIKFKLKVQAAYDTGLDKDPTQQNELQNFRRQIADNIINEEAHLKAMVKEAFERSQKEIHLANIFIEVPGNADTTEGYKKIYAAYTKLKEGKDFAAVSQEFSTEESTRLSKGDIGFITVLTLPYDLETIVYNLLPNSFSVPAKTKAGYYIFKNAGERKSLGSRRVAQILVTIPADATIEDKKTASNKADSVYKLLLKGASFEDMATTVSNDLSSNNNKGELPEFTTGTYSSDFENVAFSLKTSGDLSKPFQTSHGFHILKLLEAKPAASDLSDPVVLANFEEKVSRDNRMEKSKRELMEKKLLLIKYKRAKFNKSSLFIFTDSNMNKANPGTVKGINKSTLLFSFAKQSVKAGDWIKFVQSERNSSNENSQKNYVELFDEFVQSTSNEYYQKNLDDYSPDFRKQVEEFKEANLLFAIMEKNVWSKANADTTSLIQYYNVHKSKYTWSPGADAIVVTCNNLKLAQEIQQKLKDSVSSWRKITGNYGSNAVADSSRFEFGQLAVAERTNFTPHLLTTPVKNISEGTYTFNYIVNVYREAVPRSFEDSRGMVISDYQQILEDKWVEKLKKKYPVKVNEAVFSSIK